MQPVTLRTARVELSVPTAADVDAITAACQDPLIQRYTTVPSPYARSHAEDFVRKATEWWDAEKETTWALRHPRQDGELAGMIGLHRLRGREAELGYWTAPAQRGQGLVAEAARAVLDWGFSSDGLGLVRIEWRAVAGNVASARTARTLGFRYGGTLRAALVNGAGIRHDAWIADLLVTDDRTPQAWPVLA
ncbi:GNAT family N-acetyltransferase [Microbacterium sp. No. 7]|uniref:GNAT family N-acetyltransferase n=1 Tax=Microbacterium sp. No. 7 TaxID=1714373 RepID=UPI0006CFA48F|nr:GNAT family N-acetyltransferase [Microbacterium sp. No. 7]ALJ19326.1 acetyltransferase [Microbacterium sp. No. 7]